MLRARRVKLLACAAALKTLDLMARADLPARAEQIGEIMLGRFRAWQNRRADSPNDRGNLETGEPDD